MAKFGILSSLVLFSTVALSTGLAAQKKTAAHRSTTHVIIPQHEMQWRPIDKGADVAVLQGDPFNMKAIGVPFTFRVRHQDGFILKPHWHPMDETITVLTGMMLLGSGERLQLDSEHVRALSAGDFAVMPKIERHYFQVRGETIVQFQGIGPFRMTFVDPADDPRPPAERH